MTFSSIFGSKTVWGGITTTLTTILAAVSAKWPNVIRPSDIVLIMTVVSALGGLSLLIYGRIDASTNGKIVTLTGAPPDPSTNPHSL